MKRIAAIIFLYCFCTAAQVLRAGEVVNSSHLHFGFLKEEEDSLGVVVTQNATYLMPGQMFEISIFSRCNAHYKVKEINIGEQPQEWKDEKVYTYGFPVVATGNYNVPIHIQFVNAAGSTKQKSYYLAYTVGQANAFVSLDKMNVLYTGIDNPISVAAVGGSYEKLAVSIVGGGGSIMNLGPGRYSVRVNTITDECTITVQVGGKVAGMSQFRVRQVPVPVGSVGGIESGNLVSRNAFLATSGVMAAMKDFPFDIHHEVTGFRLAIHRENGVTRKVTCKGALFSPEARKLMEDSLVPGNTVIIDNLFVKAPDGRERKLLPLVYDIRQD